MEQPSQGQLRRSDIQLLRQSHERCESVTVGSQVFGIKPRIVLPEIILIQFFDGTREKAAAERGPGDQGNSEFSQCRQ